MLLLVSILAIPILCIAQVIPTAPGPGEIFRTGTKCTIKWEPDTAGTWDSFDIDLMSGSNNNMTHVTNVVSELDGASSSSYSWICPTVQPNAAIYFYQFNQKDASTNAGHAWTTRFTIASENGDTTSPEHSKQPNGDPIPWGIGKLTFVDDHSKSHNGTVHLPSHTHITAEEATSSTRRVETTTPPEVTLDVPAPKPTRKSRRNAFKTIYRSGSHPGNSPCRATNIASAACKTKI